MNTYQDSKPISDQKFNGGPWNQQQCIKYLIFLDQNKIVMASRQKKKQFFSIILRRFRVFDQISDFLETRSSLQCRSHHQKAIEKYKQVKQIILHEKQLIDNRTYRLKLKEFKQKAKVKQNYENVQKIKSFKQNLPSRQSQKQIKQLVPQQQQLQQIPNFINIQAYPYQIFSVTPNPLLSNYFFYPYFNPN